MTDRLWPSSECMRPLSYVINHCVLSYISNYFMPIIATIDVRTRAHLCTCIRRKHYFATIPRGSYVRSVCEAGSRNCGANLCHVYIRNNVHAQHAKLNGNIFSGRVLLPGCVSLSRHITQGAKWVERTWNAVKRLPPKNHIYIYL